MFEALKHEITLAAQQALPNEMCGVIHAGKFIQLENAHPDPVNHFRFKTADADKYVTDKQTQAIVHSHPPEELEGESLSRLSPSEADMLGQLAGGIPWVITAYNVETGVWEFFDWGKHTLDLPLLERPFRHGVEDCYTVIRKWWWQKKGVVLPEFPRDEGWWGQPGKEPPRANLYIDGFAKAGFKRHYPTLRELRPGDVFLFKLGSERYNHAGIFVGNGQVVHHPPTKLSAPGPVGSWFSRIDFWLRRED